MAVPTHKVLSAKKFIQVFKESSENKQRFCFILGAGASVDSGIPTGNQLEMQWMNYLMGKTPHNGTYASEDETEKIANQLYADDEMEHTFAEIKKAWEEAVKDGKNLSSEYYFDLYKLRFHPNPRNGYRFLEKIMVNRTPSLGYHTLALLMTSKELHNLHNLVITTNFDSLLEDALFLFTDQKPLVISHESLAAFIDSDTQRPIIAKVHRGLMFDPFNSPETTNHLEKEWHEALDYALKTYTPVVIGYGGGDGSLMSYLEKTNSNKGIYWCYLPKYGQPSSSIQRLVKSKDGCLVEIDGFDQFFLELGLNMFPDGDITPPKTGAYLTKQVKERIFNYRTQFYEAFKKEGMDEILSLMSDVEKRYENEKLAGNVPLTAVDYLYRGDRKRREGKLDEAIQEYCKAIEVDPDYAEPYISRGIMYGNQGKYEQSITDFSEAIRCDSSLSHAYYNRALCYKHSEKYHKAIDDNTTAIRLNPSYISAYINRGNCYAKLEQYDHAIYDYDKAIELDSSNAMPYINRGNCYGELKQIERAIQDYDKAIELDSNYAVAYNNRGNSYSDLKQHEQAIQDYDKAIELDPNYAFAYYNRGLSYADLKQYERAIQDYDKAIELEPNDAAAYNNRGLSYAGLKQYERAIQDYDKAIELNPNYADAYNCRAFSYAHIEEFDKSISDIEKSLSLRPDDPYALHTYGFIYLQQEDWSKTIEYFNRSIEYLNKQHAPNNKLKIAYEDRAKAYRALEKFDLAEADEAKAAELEAKQNKKGNP